MQSLARTAASGTACGVEKPSNKDFSSRVQISLWPRRGESEIGRLAWLLGVGLWFPNLFAQRASKPTSAWSHHYNIIALRCVLGFGWFKSPLDDSNVQSS